MFSFVAKVSFVLCVVTISLLSLSPSESVPQVGGFDKVVHFLSYFFLSLSFWLGFNKVKAAWFVLVLLVLFGVCIEILQSFVPGRMMSFMDAVANALGVLAGFWMFMAMFNVMFKAMLKNKMGNLK